MRVLGTVRLATNAHGDRPSVDVDVPGSPFDARVYRSNSSGGWQRKEEAAGTATIETRRVLSFLDPSAVEIVRDGMTAVIPACSQNGNIEERVTIQRVRRYGPSVQCDLLDTKAKKDL